MINYFINSGQKNFIEAQIVDIPNLCNQDKKSLDEKTIIKNIDSKKNKKDESLINLNGINYKINLDNKKSKFYLSRINNMKTQMLILEKESITEQSTQVNAKLNEDVEKGYLEESEEDNKKIVVKKVFHISYQKNSPTTQMFNVNSLGCMEPILEKENIPLLKNSDFLKITKKIIRKRIDRTIQKAFSLGQRLKNPIAELALGNRRVGIFTSNQDYTDKIALIFSDRYNAEDMQYTYLKKYENILPLSKKIFSGVKTQKEIDKVNIVEQKIDNLIQTLNITKNGTYLDYSNSCENTEQLFHKVDNFLNKFSKQNKGTSVLQKNN